MRACTWLGGLCDFLFFSTHCLLISLLGCRHFHHSYWAAAAFCCAALFKFKFLYNFHCRSIAIWPSILWTLKTMRKKKAKTKQKNRFAQKKPTETKVYCPIYCDCRASIVALSFAELIDYSRSWIEFLLWKASIKMGNAMYLM